MTVHFIGAGPGAPDLITIRGRDLIASSKVCLFAGSLVPTALLGHCPPGAKIVDTAPMSLDMIIAEIEAAHAAGHDVARLHSGDLSVWSAMGEQLRRLRALDIPYDVTPGVPSFAAAAAALGAELTLPGVTQSVVLTRTSGRASAMPEGETLAAFAHRCDAGNPSLCACAGQGDRGAHAALRPGLYCRRDLACELARSAHRHGDAGNTRCGRRGRHGAHRVDFGRARDRCR